jgi:hypothetical protein
MPLTNENLYTMIGRVRSAKPNAKPEQVRTWINDAVRDVINARTYWADLLNSSVVSIPDAYAAGVASTTTGSVIVPGTATSWPVSDVVNITILDEIPEPGYIEVNCSSVTGLAVDGILLVDAGTPAEEYVPIFRVSPSTFIGKFANVHPAGVTATQSSLVNRQLRMGYNYPIFTVIAVKDPQTLVIDNPWGGPAVTSVPYQIILMYTILDSKIRRLLDGVDQQQGWPLDFDAYTFSMINTLDPQRSDNGDPRTIVPFAPSLAGNQRWEIWPSSGTARQLAYVCTRQWPEMVSMTDIPPPFLEPTIFVNLAKSSALGTKLSKDDDWYMPKDAERWERMAAAQLTQAMNNDEDRNIRDYQALKRSLFGVRSYNWQQNHASIEAFEY